MGWGLHKHICKQVCNEKPVKQGSKNIKMLKDVGMIVPKIEKQVAVYMQQDRR